MKHESRVLKDVMQCAKCLESSIEIHEVLVIRIYFLSTSSPSRCTNHIQCATRKAKGRILQSALQPLQPKMTQNFDSV